MSATEFQTPPPDGQTSPQTGRITVSMRGDSARNGGDSDGTVSPWLYIAGAIVTLSALYAVNFGLEDSGFAILTYVLAAVGYGASYFLRFRKISLRGVQVPLLTLLGFFFLLSLLFGQGVSVAESPSRNLQIALTWVAILHSYTLSNNAAVLFACVPGMTLIALVSTSTTDSEAQNAFLVFFSAATFLLVHENYLRTQAHTLQKSEPIRRPALFRSQVALAVGCFMGAILLARVTVWPMEFVGERLFPPGTINMIRNKVTTGLNNALNNNERSSYELAVGPVSATETPVLEVTCDEPFYWRAATFDNYTGHSFINTLTPVDVASETAQQEDVDRYRKQDIDPGQQSRSHFHLSLGKWARKLDLEASQMIGSRRVHQHFKVLTVTTTQICGAGRVEDLDYPLHNVNADDAGGLSAAAMPLQTNTEYDVDSIVPSISPEVLQAAPSGADAIPRDIAQTYLQIATPREAKNQVLAKLADDWTQGLTNNYEKVRAIQEKIASTCNYNLRTPAAPLDHDRVQYFLTESHQGYCDSFGAAMTMMCRYAGIPARMALGFLHGDEGAGAHTFLAKDKDRHIWAEVFFPNVGWVPFDATEGATDVTPQSDTAHKKSTTLLGWLAQQGIGLKVIELIVVVLLIYLVKTELIDRFKPRANPSGVRVLARPPGNVAILAAYNAAVKQLAHKGLIRASYMTAVEFNRLVNARVTTPEFGAALTELTEMNNRYYYGNETASPQEVTRAQAALHRLTESLRQVQRKPEKDWLASPQQGETA